ncbi:MAG: dGTPase, partial [Psychrobacter okhotskensis]
MEENCNDNIWESRCVDDAKRPNDTRSEWGRDLARLIHSSAFRRMQAKTQVLGLGESDFYRTRLTHSMEVAQIGTGILEVLKSKNKYNEILPSSTLMQAICLSHDIGHPPFGHGGEVALNKCMLDYGGFEGNGQTLRILSKLEKYTEAHGINPTRRMMLGV